MPARGRDPQMELTVQYTEPQILRRHLALCEPDSAQDDSVVVFQAATRRELCAHNPSPGFAI